jgi:hypothetical protein
MKKIFVLATLLIISAFWVVSAQNDRDWQSKVYNLGEYSTVRLEGGFRVYLIQGDHYEVKVKTPDSDVFDKLRITNSGGKLSVKVNQSIFDYTRVNLYFTFKELSELEIEGGVNLKTNGYLDLKDFSTSVKGGATIELNMKAQKVKFIGEGGFILEIKGVSDFLDLSISGAGHISAAEMKSKDVKFAIYGFGTGSVNPIQSLDATIEGVGMIKYKGTPKVNQNIDGLGSVKPLD